MRSTIFLSVAGSLIFSGFTSATPLRNLVKARAVAINGYDYAGCFTEATFGRALSSKATFNDLMTTELCATACTGYKYFGTEYGRECFCGNFLAEGSKKVPEILCSFNCPGDDSQKCGAGSHLTTYALTGTLIPHVDTPALFRSLGCYTEATTGRALAGAGFVDDSMTIAKCSARCTGFVMFGVEYGRECFCGDALSAGSIKAFETDCSFPCSGDSGSKCGGASRLNLYTTGSEGETPAEPSSEYAYEGCYTDSVANRALKGKKTVLNDLTIEKCSITCSGYNFFGLEYGKECFCSNTVGVSGQIAAESDCSFPCSGDPSQKCGAGERLNLYKFVASSQSTTSFSVVLSSTSTLTTTEPITTTTTTTESMTTTSTTTAESTTTTTTSTTNEEPVIITSSTTTEQPVITTSSTTIEEQVITTSSTVNEEPVITTSSTTTDESVRTSSSTTTTEEEPSTTQAPNNTTPSTTTSDEPTSTSSTTTPTPETTTTTISTTTDGPVTTTSSTTTPTSETSTTSSTTTTTTPDPTATTPELATTTTTTTTTTTPASPFPDPCGALPYSNFITNPGFEDALLPSGENPFWTNTSSIYEPDQAYFQTISLSDNTTPGPLCGTQVGRFHSSLVDPTAYGTAAIEQQIDGLVAGQQYRFTAYVAQAEQQTEGSTCTVDFLFVGQDSGASLYPYYSFMGYDSQWNRFTEDFTPDATSGTFSVYFYCTHREDIYIDQISISPIPTILNPAIR